NVSFSHNFGSEPVVLSQIQTNNNGIDYIEPRQRDVSATGYRVTNEPADHQSTSITKAETIGYLAIGTGSGSWSGLDFHAGITGDNVDHRDQSIAFASNLGSGVNFVAQLHTFDGGDNSHVDADNLTGSGVNVSVQEDRTLDSEVNHTSERVGWLAIGGSGKLTAASGTGFKIASTHVEFTHTPDNDVHGVQTFNYTVEDTNSNTDTATASLHVAPEVDTVTDNLTTPEDTTLNANVLSNDNFEGSVTLTGVSSPANGTLSFDSAGNITYTPSLNFVGTETLTYTVTEDHVGATETGTLVIQVTPLNDDPIAKDDSARTDEDSSVSGDVTPGTSGQDSDIDGDTLTVSKINGLSFTPSSPILLPSGAQLTIDANGLFTYDTNAAFEALNLGDQTTDSFEYEISDGKGGTDKATVTITIDGRDENVAPIAVANSSLDNTSGFPVTVPVLANDSDSDGTLNQATIQITGTAAPGDALNVANQGTWSVNPSSGSITFTPLPSFNGDPTPISYTVQDDDGAISNAATVTVTYFPDISMGSSEMLDAGIDTLQAVAALRNIDGSAGLSNDQIVLNTVADISRLHTNAISAFGSVFGSFNPELFA
ncbi:MAG: Ig-like domain-containing protein, partial [Pseudomonadota bacterium]